ncbi:hypothetical protein [Moraxella nonliquefaciens]|nr:hypothetical protein [Moraxella nonliquefaciens]
MKCFVDARIFAQTLLTPSDHANLPLTFWRIRGIGRNGFKVKTKDN